MQRNTYLRLTSVSEAQQLWFERAGNTPEHHVLGSETLPLAQCNGRILAKTAPAKLSSPAFHGAAMDGIAVFAKDTFGASQAAPKTLFIGKNAYWINTGRPMPPGTNAVIMMEHLVVLSHHPQGEAVSIEKSTFPWQHVRKLGEDFVASEIVLPLNTLIGAYELGALAAAGVYNPEVYCKPKVAFIPSGSELVPLHEASFERLQKGDCLPEFNSLIIDSLVQEAGGETILFPIVPDTPSAIRAALEKASVSDAHLIILNAGSSAGSHDYTAACIAELGEVWVHGVSIMPGKPTVLGTINKKPVIGLPGYPISAIVAFELFGKTLLCRWQKREMPERPVAYAIPSQNIPSRPGMEEMVRVKLGQVDDNLVAVPLPRGAGIVSSLSRADGLLHVPLDQEGILPDIPTSVRLLRNRQHIAGTLLAIGSHDNTLDIIDSFLRKHTHHVSLTSAHVGSLGGLIALKEGRCHLAGTHLLCAETGTYNQSAIKKYLPDTPVDLIRLVTREQGFMVAQGNPLQIKSIHDLARNDVVFINRQRGSGTRVLLDWLLQQQDISPQDITGYDDEEYTHMTVAAAVISGKAHVGLGVQAAANALGLDFIPVGQEEYDLAIPARFRNDARIQVLLEVIQGGEFKKTVLALGGYSVKQTGTCIWQHSP